MKRILSFLKKLIPSVLQVAVVAGFFIIAVVAYNLGAERNAPDASSQVAAPASRPSSTHAIDKNGDGIIYVGPMHPQIQQDEPGDCPICGMELVPMDVSEVATPAGPVSSGSESTAKHPIDLNGDGTIYTCSMHPQIKQDESGNCPICGMELVPVDVEETISKDIVDHSDHAAMSEPEVLGYACAMNCVPPLEEAGKCPICGMEMQPVVEDKAVGPTDGDPTRRLTMSPEARALASIQTSPVVSRVPKRTIRLVGELAISEDTLAHISADVGGRIDELAAEYEGDVVAKGEDLVLLYSPELLAVQQEFLQAKGALERLPESTLETVRRASGSAIEAARERLRLSGLAPEQIDALAETGKAHEQVTIKAPIGGTVVQRHAQEGQYIKKGERILTIANLDTLWAEMAAYESDLLWLRVGQPVTFTSEAFPGRKFKGEVAWMDPVTNMRTRTTRIRLNVDNEGGMLRPGMYLTARVESTLGEEPKLVIPSSAPLITGERAVVYLQVPNAERPTFQGVEVVLGPRVEEGYVVEEGLAEGQRVVTNGAFQIDSALQIIAKRSMMNPGGGIAMTGHEAHGGPPATGEVADATSSKEAEHDSASAQQAHGESHAADLPLDELITSYLQIQRALAQDNIEHARHGWIGLRGKSEELAKLMPEADSLKGKDALRSAFHILSQHVISRAQNHPEEIHRELRLVHCPMAFDFSGADWLQAEAEVRNPYFGAEMLTCGTVKQEWPAHD